jgi:hypothetical protein
MDKLAATLKAAPVAMFLLALLAGAATAATPGASNLSTILPSLSPSLVESVHCRRFVHTHRRCIRWRGGACRSWRVVRHRCG